jgi:hypothetical protein
MERDFKRIKDTQRFLSILLQKFEIEFGDSCLIIKEITGKVNKPSFEGSP